MALVNVPIVNSTLVNAQLLEKRRQFIINDCEMLRREFEVYGLELSDYVLDLYRKVLILYNANVVWDIKPVSFRRCYQQTYTNNTNKLAYEVPVVYNVPIGFKSIDPLTLSFMTADEFKKLAGDILRDKHRFMAPTDGVSASMPIFDNRTPYMDIFSPIGYIEIEAAYIAKYGAFNANYITNGTYPSTLINVPKHQIAYQEAYYSILSNFQTRSTVLPKYFQNPTLEMKSLIPEFRKMFEQNPYQKNGIPYKDFYDYEKIHFAAVDNYFLPYRTKLSASSIQYTDSRSLLLNGMIGYLSVYFNSNNSDTTVTPFHYMNQTRLVVQPTLLEATALRQSYVYPSTDTRTDYQKAFTYSTLTPDALSVKLNSDPISKNARMNELNKKFIEDHGGHVNIIQNLFWIIAEAHASVMTPININNPEFFRSFKKCLTICVQKYQYNDGLYDQPSRYEYMTTGGQRLIYGTPVTIIEQAYVFLNNNFKVETFSYNKSYSGGNGDLYPMTNDGYYQIMKASGSTGIYSAKVTVPVDPTQPFPYYMIQASGSNNHMVKTTALLGIQKLRNGFLYQDIARQFEPTFVNFAETAIGHLESLASKQIAMFDLLTDVKSGNIFTKAITTSTPKQPFNPLMPEYVTTTTYQDMIRTTEGDQPILHPEMGYEIKWQQIHSELVIQSSYFYQKFIETIASTVNDYNNRVATYILKLLEEMKALSVSYVQAEADKLRAEQEQTKLDLAIEKLKTGVFINENGKEYWRPLLPEEKIEVDKMILRIETNIATEKQNVITAEQNAKALEAANAAQIAENARLQALADAKAVELNKQYQAEADAKVAAANLAAQKAADERQIMLNNTVIEEDTQWKRDNIDNLKAPTFGDLHKIAKEKNTILSDALIHWENANPFYTYNANLAIEIAELRKRIIQIEVETADKLVQIKLSNSQLGVALMELFPEQAKRIY